MRKTVFEDRVIREYLEIPSDEDLDKYTKEELHRLIPATATGIKVKLSANKAELKALIGSIRDASRTYIQKNRTQLSQVQSGMLAIVTESTRPDKPEYDVFLVQDFVPECCQGEKGIEFHVCLQLIELNVRFFMRNQKLHIPRRTIRLGDSLIFIQPDQCRDPKAELDWADPKLMAEIHKDLSLFVARLPYS